ncbi:MAG: hypothetical protein AB7R69_00325 [Candidatus Babeliales bacterium]
MKKISILTILLLHGIFMYGEYAVVTAPVVDCTGEPLGRPYHELPISWAGQKNSIENCPRIHQLLFNEVVTVLEEREYEALVAAPHFFMQSGQEKKNTVWTLKKNLTYFSKLHESEKRVIPQPLSYQNPDTRYENTITLKLPYYHEETNTLFSAGTRFIMTKKNNHYYSIVFYNPQVKATTSAKVPLYLCTEPSQKGNNQKIDDFVTLLRMWASEDLGSIPLVWGGTSFTEKYYPHTYTKEESISADGQLIEYWQPSFRAAPFTGFDASGLILRAAQICGIPYYFKNTITAAKNLKPLQPTDSLLQGDLLFVPGGLLVVSCLEHNRIIAAIGYQFGYGKIVELPLEKLFLNATTYEDILNLSYAKEPLYTKKADGSLSREIEQFCFLRMASCWEK